MRRRTTICLLNKSRDLIILFLGAVLTCCCMVFIGFNPLTFTNPDNEKLIYAHLDGCSGALNTTGITMTTKLTSTWSNSTVKLTDKPHPLKNTTSVSTVLSRGKIPSIYFITPTYKRLTQKADLIRICQTLMLVPNIVWILIEDDVSSSELVTNLLEHCSVKSVHLTEKTTSFVSRKQGGGGHRGVDQRNLGLKWIHDNVNELEGVVYFGDDDNTYDIRLFEEMRHTRRVSVWPVAFVGLLNYEGPKCENGSVVGWHVSFRPDRKFPLDMAAFAVSLSLIFAHPNLYINAESKPGMLECNFLSSLGMSVHDLEPKANNCRSIYVWHTKTVTPKMSSQRKNPGDNTIEI